MQRETRTIDRLTSRPRIVRYPLLLLALSLALYLPGALRARAWIERDGQIIGRDFFAFFMAGEMVRTDRTKELYDLAAQQEWQRAFMTPINPRWSGTCLYLNPPHYAWVMSWISRTGYGPALAIWWLASLLAFAATLFIWRSWWGAGGFGIVITLTVCLPAWFQAFVGGQNSFFSLFVLTAFCALLLRERDALAGLVLALLAWKFQLLLVPLLLLLCRRRWRALAGFTLGIVATLALTAATLGTQALAQYARFASNLGGLLQIDGFDVYKQHSWHGFFALLGANALSPTMIRALTAIASCATLGLFAAICREPWSRQRLPLVLSATMVANLLVCPHLFHYDLVIAALPAVLWFTAVSRDTSESRAIDLRPVLVAGYVWLGVSPLVAGVLHVQLTPWLLLAWLVIALHAARVYAAADERTADELAVAAKSPDRDGPRPRPAGHAV